MMEIGKSVNITALEHSSGQMEVFTKESGEIVEKMEEVNSQESMGLPMKENGKTVNIMEKVNLLLQMARCTLDCLRMENT